MSRPLQRRATRDAIVLVPAALGSAGMGVGAAYDPLVGAGLGAVTAVTFLPWIGLFTVLVLSALANKWGYDAAGVTLRVAQVMLVPFAARTYFLTSAELRPRWKVAEWLAIAFVGLNLLSSRFNSVLFKPSFLVVLILSLGVITYLAVYIGACTRERVITMARIVLSAVAAGAAIGILALLAHFATGSTLGIDLRYTARVGGAPSVSGLAWEHDIFGSTCGFGAIAFLVLLWDGDGHPLFRKRRTVEICFWTCFVGMAVSLARGAWIGFAVTFVLLLILRRPRRNKPSRTVRAAMVLIMLGVGATGFIWATGQNEAPGVESPIGTVARASAISVGQQLRTIVEVKTGSGAGRLRKYDTAVQEMSQSPETLLVGMGTDSYGQRHFHPSAHTFPYLASAYLESLYVRSLYDSGVLGLGVLIVFLGTVLWPFGGLRRWSGDLGPVARALVFGWIVVAVAFAVTDSMLLLWPWLTLGLVRAAKTQAERQDREIRSMPPPQVDLVPNPAALGNGWGALTGQNGGRAPG